MEEEVTSAISCVVAFYHRRQKITKKQTTTVQYDKGTTISNYESCFLNALAHVVLERF